MFVPFLSLFLSSFIPFQIFHLSENFGDFLRSKNVAARLVTILLEQGVDFSNMSSLDHEALKEFGVGIWGDRFAILKAIGKA
jgi:hypothetical protein